MDIPWPERGERLFVGGGHAAHAACIIPEEISLVAVGYKDAADILVQVLGERGRNDALVFPIVFCYRQCLELQIKAITRLVESFDGCGDDFQKIHGLARLWRVIEPRLRQEDGGAEAAAFYAVQERIEEFDRFDSNGVTFRYGDRVIMHQIDLGHLQSRMDEVFTFLSALTDYWETR